MDDGGGSVGGQPTLKLLIWDFDGTLAHRPGMWSGTLLEVLDAEYPDHKVILEQLRPAIQTGFRWHQPHQPYPVLPPDEWWAELHPTFERAYQNAGFSRAEAQALAPQVRRHYLNAARWQMYPDTLPTLETLSAAGWTHVILTNHVPEFQALLASLGLTRHFAAAFNSALTGFEKPHPAAFQAVLQGFPQTQQVCMIGDSFSADIAGAQQVGLPAILVRRQDERAQWQGGALSDVPALLARIFH